MIFPCGIEPSNEFFDPLYENHQLEYGFDLWYWIRAKLYKEMKIKVVEGVQVMKIL